MATTTNKSATKVKLTASKSKTADELAVDALDLMRRYNISQLVVLQNGMYAGLLHLHDLIREGLI